MMADVSNICVHEKWHKQFVKIPVDHHDETFENGTRKNSWYDPCLDVKKKKKKKKGTDIRMNENLNTSKLNPVLHRGA